MRAKTSGIKRLSLKRVALLFLALFTFLVLSFAFVSHADSSGKPTGYVSVRIESGDTITSIATDHLASSGLSFDDMVFEIRRLNRIATDTIYTGAYLIVPVQLS